MPETTLDIVPPRLTSWPREIALGRRAGAFLGAYANLLWLDLCMRLGFRTLRGRVARCSVAPTRAPYDALTLVRVAVRDACIFYVKPVHCLQRSAAVTRMLRRRGLPAQMVIGFRPMPIAPHAWVELDGVVVWDSQSALRHFSVIDRV